MKVNSMMQQRTSKAGNSRSQWKPSKAEGKQAGCDQLLLAGGRPQPQDAGLPAGNQKGKLAPRL